MSIIAEISEQVLIRVALFASGTGSNAMNLLRMAAGLKEVQIPLVIVDQKNSGLPACVRVEFPEVKVEMIECPIVTGGLTHSSKKEQRHLHELKIIDALKAHSIDWCFLAGYLRLIGPTLLGAFTTDSTSRIVNIHPSLLPDHPGLSAYAQAFAAQKSSSGISVHFVDLGLDTGPIIAQKTFPKIQGDTLETFIERGKKIEWQLYAEVLKRLNDQGDLNPMARNS